MDEQNEVKTAAELEAEARERARAEIDGDKPVEGAVAPGQPQVVKHTKRRSRRTLVLAVISLVLLVIIAATGDYLMAKLKGDKTEKADEGQPPSTATTPARERQNLGRDLNPLGALADDRGHDETPPADAPQANEATPPPPLTFDKVSALAETDTVSSTGAAPKRQATG